MNLYQNDDGTWDVYAGCSITPTINEAISLAASAGKWVTFKFNDVIINVEGDSNPELIQRDWHRAMNGYFEPPIVGPHPKPELSPEEKDRDAIIQSENAQRAAESMAEYERKIASKLAKANQKISGVQIELKDGLQAEYEEYKAKNSDPYGGACVTYGERWAQLMQSEMAQGKKIAEIADSTSREADVEGITGFMYGCAVKALAHFWKHGEALRLWHNRTTQIGSEGDEANENGGVLNPAVLSIK
jgi:hypothetical protein